MTKQPSTSLVRPGDIQDAVDAQDLIDQFLSKNLDTVADKREQRLRTDWKVEQHQSIRDDYFAKAEKTYTQIWNQCAATKLGHDYIRIDAQGVSVDQCRICTFHHGEKTFIKDQYGEFRHDGYRGTWSDAPERRSKEMNRDLVQIMANKLIELDENAGILVWPTESDMPDRELKKQLRNVDDPNQPIIKRLFT